MAVSKLNTGCSSTPRQPNKLVTAALILPFLLFGLEKWQRSAPQMSSDRFVPLTPQAHVQVSNTTDIHYRMQGNATKFELMTAKYAASCPDQQYRTRLFSADPLIIYIENFVTKDEAAYMLNHAEPYYEPSPFSGPMGKSYNYEWRKSFSAVVPTDPVVFCIQQRAADFQGFLPVENVEDVQVVKYGVSDHFGPHFDWHQGQVNPRISTLFAYVQCDDLEDGGKCVGGGTNFPSIQHMFPKTWCDEGVVDCGNDAAGVVFEPIVGNGVFWQNFYPNGTGVQAAWHAAMPVQKGRKAGLNIWSRKRIWDQEVVAYTDKSLLSEADRERCKDDDVCYVKAGAPLDEEK